MYESSAIGDLKLIKKTTQHNYTVTSLHSKTRYAFTVKPYNSAGEGPGISIVVTTKGGKLCWCKKPGFVNSTGMDRKTHTVFTFMR